MKDLISVIVPVYNVEKYIGKCVESIERQTYDNLEIILVDDGSTDTSGLICEELARKDKRLRVFHQDNKGLSEARKHQSFLNKIHKSLLLSLIVDIFFP